MWMLSQLAPEPGAMSLVMAAQLTGQLNLTALAQAFADIAARHEVLGSVITTRAGGLVQLAGPAARAPVQLVDLSGLPDPTAQDAVRRLLRAAARRPFDLATGPLLRVLILRTAPARHLVAVAMHHIVTDGWSVGLLAREVSQLYQAYLAGRPGPLAGTPAVQYAEFARWQRATEDRAAVARCAARLADLPDTALPADGLQPGPPGRPAGIWTSALPPSVAARLQDLRRQEGGSLFMLVLAALMTVIRRLDGRDEVAVGTLAAGRSRPELESALGYFGNILVIRAAFDGQPTFRELWRRVREDCVAAYADQDVPFEQVTAHLQAARRSRIPPIRILCVMQQPDPPLRLPGLDAHPVEVPQDATQFDVTVEIRPRGGSVHLAVRYDATLFDPATISTLGQYLRSTLAAVAADPGVRCDQIALAAAPRGRPGPPAATGQPPAPAPPCLHELFEAQAARTPDATAVARRGHAVTYGQLNARANRLARELRAAGTRAEDRVGVLLDRSPEAVIALLAVLKAGAAFVPLDPAFPRQRLADLLADSGAGWVVTTAALAPPVRSAARLLLLDEPAGAATGQSSRNLGLAASPDSLACVIYTSGSTGRPAGVMIPHRGVVGRLRWMGRAHPFKPGERACHRTALSFVDSVSEVFGPLLHGVPAEIIDAGEAADPVRLAAALSLAGVTRITVVPALLTALLEEAGDLSRLLPALSLWVTSGERLPAGTAARFHAVLPGRTLLNLYGTTEVAADATAAVVPAGGAEPAIGAPIDGVRAGVVEAGGGPAPRLVAGELQVSGAAVARGYHGAPGLTAARFVPDAGGPAAGHPGARAFRTGDRVRTRADGALAFLGRADDQIQVRGHRIEPAEVEDALLRHPGVISAAVTACPDGAGGAALAAYLVLRPPAGTGEVRDFARDVLPAHLLPSLLISGDTLPLTAGGKVDRRQLPWPDITRPPAPGARQPETPAELAVAQVFAELLPVGWQSVDDDFFGLGGHSLLATAALHRLQDRHGAALDLRDLFAAPSIAALARLMSQAPALARAGPAPAVQARPGEWHDPFPLTEVQQAYWIGRDPDLELGNVATHGYFEVDTEGLDAGRLEAAVRILVDRHAALRTVIRPDGTQQVLRSVPPYQVEVTDLRGAGQAEAATGLAAMRAAMSHQVLPADRWPMFDIRVALMPGGQERIGVSIDALIADAYSVQLLMGELGLLYRQPAARLEPPGLTFRDYVVAEAQSRDSPQYERALRYWRGRLAALPPGPELPLARSPADVAVPRFRRWSGQLGPGQWRTLREHAAEAGLTPTAMLLAAFAETLTAWSAQPHYTVTLTLFSRGGDDPRLNQVVGDFTSLTLLEVDHREPGSFLARARRLNEQLWADLDHRRVSGVTVLREWARSRERPPALIAPVVFTSNLGLPGDTAGPAGPGLGRPGFAITQTPQLYLDHQVAQRPDGRLLLSWDVVAELFPPGLISQAFGAYLGLLRRLAEQPAAWDEPAGRLAPPPQLRRRRAANSTRAPRSAEHLHAIAARGLALGPGAPAVITTEVTMTHAETWSRAARVAHRLRALGVRRGELVGVAMTKGWEQVVSVLGISASGTC
jgi:amino acid adenylation domain-containing protein